MDAHELIHLERRGWEALSTSGAAAAFYHEVLARDPLLLLPGGLVMDDRDEIVESLGGAPWDEYDLEEMRVVELGGEAAVVAYGATARRGDSEVSSLFASTYRVEGGHWRLAVHQQTPR